MTREEIIYFIEHDLSWLVPVAYEDLLKEIKRELGL